MPSNNTWDIRIRRRLFGKTTYQVGWLNRAGFGPIEEYDTMAEAEEYLQQLTSSEKGLRQLVEDPYHLSPESLSEELTAKFEALKVRLAAELEEAKKGLETPTETYRIQRRITPPGKEKVFGVKGPKDGWYVQYWTIEAFGYDLPYYLDGGGKTSRIEYWIKKRNDPEDRRVVRVAWYDLWEGPFPTKATAEKFLKDYLDGATIHIYDKNGKELKGTK